MKTQEACLHLLPVPLFEDRSMDSLSPDVRSRIASLSCLVVESLKMGKRWVKWAGGVPEEVQFWELNEHDGKSIIPEILELMASGKDVGLISDAGCPAIADPGAVLVERVHQAGYSVVPYPGPSSILMGLMASGFDTQRFAFMGYLPVDPGKRKKMILDLEARSTQWKEAIAFIETPYRNDALLAELLKSLKPNTRLCVMADYGAAGPALLKSCSVSRWRALKTTLGKLPAVFVLAAF